MTDVNIFKLVVVKDSLSTCNFLQVVFYLNFKIRPNRGKYFQFYDDNSKIAGAT